MAGFSLTSTKESKYRVTDFTGGLNNKFSKTSLSDNEASDLLNIVIEERGALYKRKGLKVNSDYPTKPGTEIQRIDKFIRRDNSKEIIVFYVDGSIRVNAGFMVLKDKDANVLTRSTEKCSSFIFYDTYYFGNKVDGWFKYTTGNEAVRVDSIPKAAFAIVNNNRVYYANIDEQPDRIYFSHQGNAEDVTIIVGTDENQNNVGGIFDFPTKELPITGISVFQGSLLVFKRDGIFTVNGYDYTDFEIKRLTVATGCAVNDGVVLGDNLVYYIGYDGVYYISSPSQEVVESTPVSVNITPEFNEVNRDKIFCFHHKSKLYLFMENKTLIFDERLKSWSKWDTVIRSAMHDDDIDKMVLGGVKGYIYTLDNALKDEYEPEVFTPIRGVYSTPYFSFGEPETTKKYKWVKIFYRPNAIAGSEINFFYDIDYVENNKQIDVFFDTLVWEDDGLDGEDNTWGDEYWGDVRAQMSKKVRFSGKGEMVKLTFINEKLEEDLGIFQLVFGFIKKEKVK